MPSKIDPRKLTPLAFPARPDPRADWTSDPALIADALGVAELGPADCLRLELGHRYSPAAAGHFMVCCERYMNHSKGRWAGEPMRWLEWQEREWVRPIFGWMRPTGDRSIRRAYIECGKKSGKSTFAAAVQLYMLVFFGEQGAEIYSLASTREQAEIVQNQVEDMVTASPELEQRAMIQHNKHIMWPQTNSGIYCKSGRGRSGYNPFCCVFDELHEWRGMESFEKWTYGSRARDNYLHLAITNAGDDEQSVCWRQREYAAKVLAGEVKDPDWHARIYAVSRETAESEVARIGGGSNELVAARQTNPGLETMLRADDLIADIRRAVHIPAEMPNLLRFTYCVWRTSAKLEWLKPIWGACQAKYTLADLAGQPCWLGLDLSIVHDMSALVLVARLDADRYRVWPWFWLPAQRARELAKFVPTEGWQAAGRLTVTSEAVIDQNAIKQAMLSLAATHDVQGLVYDPREASLLIREIEGETGWKVYPFKQSMENYHEPTEAFEGLIRSRGMEHPGCPILTWQAEHALVRTSTQGYRKPVKPDPDGAPHRGVDGIQALIMALSQARLFEDEGPRIYALD